MVPPFFGPLHRRAAYSMKSGPEFYSYAYYRENFQSEIAEDCLERCVYCDSHETDVGGREAMQIDHFRPYTTSGFEHLENDPSNFHHACARCNLLKSDYWDSTDPNASHDNRQGFVDPFLEPRSKYFRVGDDGQLIAVLAPANYTISLLALNRPYLKRLRERRILLEKADLMVAQLKPKIEAAVRTKSQLTRDELMKLLVFLETYELCRDPL